MRRACLSLAPQAPRLVTLRPDRSFRPLAERLQYARHQVTAKLPYRTQIKSALHWIGRGR
jgi:hypothetical protein